MTLPIESKFTISPTEISTNYENAIFTAQDGLILKGWLFKGVSDKLIIMVAGTNQNRTNPDYGTVSISKELLAKGYTMLLFDRRSTGESQGERVLFGVPEHLDIIAAVEFAKKKGFEEKKIGIIGNSLGAISTLLAIEEIHEVGAVVIDSSAADVKEIIEHILKTEKHVPEFLCPGIFLAGRLAFGIDTSLLRPIDKVAKVPERTFLYLHGEKDVTIPPDHSRRLLEKSNQDSKLVLFKNATHIQTYKIDPVLYRKEVFEFLESELSKEQN